MVSSCRKKIIFFNKFIPNWSSMIRMWIFSIFNMFALYWRLKFEGWVMRMSLSVALVKHRLPSQIWISKLETWVTHLILKDLNNGPELDKFEKKLMTFRLFFCKPNILLILVCDVNFPTWGVYVSLCWKSAWKIRRRFS